MRIDAALSRSVAASCRGRQDEATRATPGGLRCGAARVRGKLCAGAGGQGAGAACGHTVALRGTPPEQQSQALVG
jgi:hypothetical protein